jgi:hypothetical protein
VNWREPGASFGQVAGDACPRDGGPVTYRFGNWRCETRNCNWSTARDVNGGNGGRVTLENCPSCGSTVIYNGNYFCVNFDDGCVWALPHPARRKADRAMALRLTGDTA